MAFKPRRWLGVQVGLSIVAGAGLIALLTARYLAREPLSLATLAAGGILLALVLLAALFAYWSYGCISLHYHLNRNRLAIRWAFTYQYIPLPLIKALIRGGALPKPSGIKGVNWPGYHVGRGWVEGIGETLFYSTHRSKEELLYILTPSLAYAISVADPLEFAAEIQRRKRLGSLEPISDRARHWPLAALPFWRDRAVQSLFLFSLFLNFSLFSYILYLLPSLPILLPVHLTPVGAVDRIGWRWELLGLPAAALFLLVSNTSLGIFFYTKERLLAHLSLGAGLLVQILFWVAAVRLTT